MPSTTTEIAPGFGAYVASAAADAPAVVVLHEIFGVNADMRTACDWPCAEGFEAVCPDLFWRLQPGVELSDATETEWKQGLDLYNAYDMAQGLQDIADAIAFTRTRSGVTRPVAVMGYCLGGLLTFRAAALGLPDAAVAYYGGGTQDHLREVTGLHVPLLMHLAGDDEYMPAAAQAQIRDAMASRPGVQVQTYPGCRHAFARNRGAHFDPAAASLANARTIAFLRTQLTGCM